MYYVLIKALVARRWVLFLACSVRCVIILADDGSICDSVSRSMFDDIQHVTACGSCRAASLFQKQQA